MVETAETRGPRQHELLLALLHKKAGLPVEGLAERLGISRNGVRQHLTALERDGMVQKGAAIPSGGRPEQLYVLTQKGLESFPRQYSWFAELLLQDMAGSAGDGGLKARLASLGRAVGLSLKAKLAGAGASPERIAALAAAMTGLGYDAAVAPGGELEIEAQNCVYHALAARNQDVCTFDLALLAAGGDAKVEHRSCMVRGAESCRFRFTPNARRKGS